MAKVVKNSNHLEDDYNNSGSSNSSNNSGSSSYNSGNTKVSVLLKILQFILSLFGINIGTNENQTSNSYKTTAKSYSSQSAEDEDDEKEIIAAGIEGEQKAAVVLSKLPSDYYVFQDTHVTYDGKTSEIDNIIVGSSGVFIVETKNHKGTISGGIEDENWHQYKVGKTGTVYEKDFYSPVQQIETHIYRLAKFLKTNDARCYVRGIVYFTNEECELKIDGERDDIPVFCSGTDGDSAVIKYIKNGPDPISQELVNKVIKLLKGLKE